MLKKKSEKSFHKQMQEARATGDVNKWMEVSRRASMAYNKEMKRLRELEAKIKEDLYNKSL
jgi:type III secretory pathway component EscU